MDPPVQNTGPNNVFTNNKKCHTVQMYKELITYSNVQLNNQSKQSACPRINKMHVYRSYWGNKTGCDLWDLMAQAKSLCHKQTIVE